MVKNRKSNQFNVEHAEYQWPKNLEAKKKDIFR
jgi:hypothetical protein